MGDVGCSSGSGSGLRSERVGLSWTISKLNNFLLNVCVQFFNVFLIHTKFLVFSFSVFQFSVLRFLGSWVLGFSGSWVLRFFGSWVLRFLGLVFGFWFLSYVLGGGVFSSPPFGVRYMIYFICVVVLPHSASFGSCWRRSTTRQDRQPAEESSPKNRITKKHVF